MLWTLKKLKRFGSSLCELSSLFLPPLVALLRRICSVEKSPLVMIRRVVTTTEDFLVFRYKRDDKEVGIVTYRMNEGTFSITNWVPEFSALKRISELLKMLSYARKLVKDEIV